MDLTRDAILAQDDCEELVPVDVPAWGGRVYLKVLTSNQLDMYQLRYANVPKTQLVGMRAFLLSLSLCDANGELLFTTKDLGALGSKSSVVMDMLFELASEINGLNRDAVDTAKKNLETSQSDASGTSLPLPSEDAASANGNASLTAESSSTG